MTRCTITRRFGDRERERLIKLFRVIGTDNTHEAEAARGRIDSLLREFSKNWADLVQLLGGTIHPDLARDIVALGSSNPDERSAARFSIAELLARFRKNWNDLADALISSAAWASNASADDPPREPDLVGLIHYMLEQYVVLKPHEYIVGSLWTLHTHVYDRFMVTPRLALRSPVADCGKTTLLDVLARLTARADKFDAISTAALFRLIDATHPTLLIDEVDNLGLALQPNGRLRAVFNSGHRKGGIVAIQERGSTRRYSTFAPLALALPDTMVGLPRTLNSRSITMVMQRHAGHRELRRFDVGHPDPALDATYRQILLWRRGVELNSDPEMPAGMRNRFADNWRPLISIADALGWGEQAREAMGVFAREFQDADVKVLLLSDIRTVFDTSKADRLPSKTLIAALHGLDADWNEFHGIRGAQQPHKLKEIELASMLREFKIRPCTIWPLNRTAKSRSAKGYRRSHFEEAWRAYCTDDDTPAHHNSIRTLRLASDGTVWRHSHFQPQRRFQTMQRIIITAALLAASVTSRSSSPTPPRIRARWRATRGRILARSMSPLSTYRTCWWCWSRRYQRARVIPLARSGLRARLKSRREYRVPLAPPALALLKHLYREDGHRYRFVGGSFGGIAGVYQRNEFTAEMHEALVRWTAHVGLAVAEGADNIIVIRRPG